MRGTLFLLTEDGSGYECYPDTLVLANEGEGYVDFLQGGTLENPHETLPLLNLCEPLVMFFVWGITLSGFQRLMYGDYRRRRCVLHVPGQHTGNGPTNVIRTTPSPRRT